MVVPPLDLTKLNANESDAAVVSESSVASVASVVTVRSFFVRYQLFFYGFVAGVAATVVGSKVRNALDSHSSYKN
jgi:hypothetical protein